MEHENGVPTEREEEEYKKFQDNKTLLLMMDSTNVDNPGFSTSEKVVCQNLDEIIKTPNADLLLALFASQLERIIAIIESAEKYGIKKL